MRNIAEIISDAKDGIVPNHEECFWTMLALSGKLHFAMRDLEAIGEALTLYNDNKLRLFCELRVKSKESVFTDKFHFHKLDPKKYVGNSHNPFSEECRQWRDMGKKIIENATGVKL